ILASSLADDAVAARYLERYFPTVVTERFGDGVRHHPLRREIVAVELANRLIDSMGMTFLATTAASTGRDEIEITKMWLAALTISGSDEIIRQIETDHRAMNGAALGLASVTIEQALTQATKWLLRTHAPDVSIASLVERFMPSTLRVMSQLTAQQESTLK